MSDKKINIHVGTPGADESARDLNKVGKAGKRVGNDMASGNKKAARSTGEANKELSNMDKNLSGMGKQVASFIGAWAGMQGVQAVLGEFEQRLERIATLQSQIYENSVKLGTVGQNLEIQGSTVGEQKEWTGKAIEIQKAGALKDIEIAKKMMVGMDITYGGQGGMKNPEILDLGKKIAPFVGAAEMSEGQVGQLFEFAGTAGIEPTEAAWMSYLAKLHKGYTSAKTDSVGDFLTGLQSSGTGFIGQGGSLDEAITMFAAARSVTQNESVASTLFEQATRFSSGGYEKPRKAVEESLGVKWEDLNMDQRMFALLKHIERIPESRRTQTMVEQGFEPGLASAVQKMVTPEAMSTTQSTRRLVRQATPKLIKGQMESYLGTDVGKERLLAAERNAMEVNEGPAFGAWQRRKKKAEMIFEANYSKGQDMKKVRDIYEPYYIAIDEMKVELDAIIKELPKESKEYKKALKLRHIGFDSVHGALEAIDNQLSGRIPYMTGIVEKQSNRRGYEIEQQLGELKQAVDAKANTSNVTNVNTTYHQDTIYNPRVGPSDKGPRFSQD